MPNHLWVGECPDGSSILWDPSAGNLRWIALTNTPQEALLGTIRLLTGAFFPQTTESR